MTTLEKLEHIWDCWEKLEGRSFLDKLESIDPTGKLHNLYDQSNYSMFSKGLDNPKIMLVNLMYKIIKDKNEDKG